MFNDYLKKIAGSTAQGDAREESYYHHLSLLLESFARESQKRNVQITTLPKKTEAGNPDFRVWDGHQHVIGYVEAKKPGENLDVVENTPQLRRYRSTFPNLILTDFYEFRLFRNDQLIEKVQIGRPFIAIKLHTTPPVEHEAKFEVLLNKFFSFSLPKVFTAESLASELAKRTRFLRDEIIAKELEEEQIGKGPIFGFYQAFKKYLIADLNEDDFADIYSQTITYGLFAARTRANGNFNRKLAFDLIPPTIGILRDVFHFISLGKVPLQMEVIIDDIAEVMYAAEVSKILHEYYRKGKGEDPIVHFYETFLNIYDPATREKRGVYYTPEPVVKYIVRAIHDLLKSHFGLQEGLASKEVTLLDPAGGTLTFPAEAIKLAVQEFVGKYGDGGLRKFIQNHILKNYYAFELMMAPYAIGHIKMSFLLEELGYKMREEDRFNLFLTNTLDMEDLAQTEIPGLESLSDESHKANKIKKSEPILVILGNPPYSGISLNKSEEKKKFKIGDEYIVKYRWNAEENVVEPVHAIVRRTKKISSQVEILQKTFIGEILQEYFFLDGKPLGEKKVWLNDDYVKFLRFSQWKIQRAGHGIVGMITNHGYLDNPTFRGMRQSLMNTFNEIYIIDLHGNSIKKETAPDGGKDENVFDIRQGTAIALMIKKRGAKGCRVFHRDIFGERKVKYNWLQKRILNGKDYEMLKPESPWYFFIKRDTKAIDHYNEWPKVNDVFPINVTGIVTARDSFVIDFSKQALEQRIRQFRNPKLDDDFIRQAYSLKDTRGWKLPVARQELIKDKNWEDYFQKILYRPFDVREIYFSDKTVDWGRPELMGHILKPNISICFVRQYSGDEEYSHALVSEYMVDNRTFFSSKGIIQQAPLYLYKPNDSKRKSQTMMLFEPQTQYDDQGRIPNINKDITARLEKSYRKTFTPEQLLHYIYAILYCNIYREKYAEFLRIDFPRIPFVSDHKLFLKASALGEGLAELHMLKHNLLTKSIAKYKGDGDDRIEKPVYNEAKQVIFINKTNYFEGISRDIWTYHIGGYQVMEKYLKDRKGRLMEDSAHYCKVATAIYHTIIFQKKMDELFPSLENNALL